MEPTLKPISEHQKKVILIAGGTGLIGSALTKRLLSAGHEVRILTSNRKRAAAGTHAYFWDISKRLIDDLAFSGVQVLYNLAGESIAGGRWRNERKKEIMESRVFGTQLLAKKVIDLGIRLEVYAGASAVGYYGNDNADVIKSEDSPAGNGFLADVCRSWEEAHAEFLPATDRYFILRLGNVISKNGGFITPFKKSAKLQIVPLMGDASLPMPWVHIDDATHFMESCLETANPGIYNLVAGSGRSVELQRALYKHLGAKIFFHMPDVFLKLIMGEMASLVLEGCAVSGEKMKNSLNELQFPDFNSALQSLD